MRRLVLAIAALGAVPALLAGCSGKGTLKPNVPPETSIFVQGPVDTVNHNVHLYWFGTDPDGYIVGYEIRMLNPSAPADTCWTWVPPDSTDRVFSVYTPAGFTAPVFEVRAIDDSGEMPPAIPAACQSPADTIVHRGTRDPSPARQDFKFRNLPPTVTLLNRVRFPKDSTYASLTLQWAASDPDGDGTKLRFRIWLDGNEAHPRVVAGSSYTIPSEDFLQNGLLRDTVRVVCIQAIDDGGMLSAVDSTHWMVLSPGTGGRHPNMGRLLLIDDVPSNYSQNFSTDTLYLNTAVRNLLPRQYSVLRMQFNNPFRSLADMEQTFKLFDAVVWYIGGSGTFVTYETTLNTYQAAIGDYLAAGGNMYLDGVDLINAPHAVGPLDYSFVGDYLGSDFLFMYFHESLMDSTAGWGLANPSYFVTGWGDSLRVQQQGSGSSSTGVLRCFGIRDNSYALVSTLPGDNLIPAGKLPFTVPVAVSVPQPAGGRMVLVSFPMRAAYPAGTTLARFRNNAVRFMAQVFQQLGLTTP